MKKLFTFILLLLGVVQSTYAKEPYAVLSAGNKILTFYYDNNKAVRGGMDVGPFSNTNDVGWFEQREKITTVVFDKSFSDCSTISSTTLWFFGFTNLTAIQNIDFLNTSNVTYMVDMFAYCSGLKNLDLSNFNTANVTDLGGMFNGCSSLASLDVSNFNTGNVTNMGYMFNGCSSLTSLDLSNFNTDNVTQMYGMFGGCSNLTSLDVSNFNTDNVIDMYEMFSGCSSLTSLDVSNFNTDNVTEMMQMFSGCSGLKSLDVRNFNTTNVAWYGLNGMFSGCSNLSSIICDDAWGGEGMNMFDGCTSLKGAISYKEGNVDMANPVYGYFTSYAYAVLSSDNTLTLYYDDNKTNRGGMAIRLNGSYGWSNQCMNIKKVVFDASFANYRYLRNMCCWFEGCSELKDVEGLEYLNTSNVITMSGMFGGCSSLTSFNLSNFNTRHLKETIGMFSGCSSLTSLDVRNFNTANVTNMGGMFSECSSLTSLDVSNFNTEKVEQMGAMFYYCSSLKSLDLSNFNINNVTNMSEMFYNCSNLSTIYCNDKWDCESSNVMFYGCEALQGAVSYDFNKNDVNYANPTTGYFTAVKPGDANADKTINIEDAVVVAKRIMGEKTERYVFVGADANCDKKVNVADIVKITNM